MYPTEISLFKTTQAAFELPCDCSAPGDAAHRGVDQAQALLGGALAEPGGPAGLPYPDQACEGGGCGGRKAGGSRGNPLRPATGPGGAWQADLFSTTLTPPPPSSTCFRQRMCCIPLWPGASFSAQSW